MDKERNYKELQKAVTKTLGMGEAFGEITFKRILEEMPQDVLQDMFGGRVEGYDYAIFAQPSDITD